MAYPILGTPIPSFFDSSGSPLVSGTVTVTDPDTASAKAVYDSASDADSQSNGVTTAITLNARGEPATELWGRDGEDYTLVIKDSAGSTVQTITDVRLPIGSTNVTKVKTADESLTDTTLAADTHLQGWTLAASSYYKVTGLLVAAAAGATQDIKTDFIFDNAPSVANIVYRSYDASTDDALSESDVTTMITTITHDIDGTSNLAILIDATILTSANETTMDLHVAQGTDSGTTTLKQGSWIKVEPLIV